MAELEPFTPALDGVEVALLDTAPTLTRIDVADQAGVPLDVATELWHLLGFAHVADNAVAFTPRDVEALRLTRDLLRTGVIDADSQAALVRTWGRSFARLAEWQTNLLAGLALDADDPADQLQELIAEVLPKVEQLQSYIWRRHLLSSVSRLLAVGSPGTTAVPMTVCFVDIVGYTTQSKNLTEAELVDWIENFEQRATEVVVDHGARVIKMIGDEILFAADEAGSAIEVALLLTERGSDEEDAFPAVRAGIASGEVVNRLGDVFGPTVNIASRLTSVARPGSVLVDRTTHDAVQPPREDDDPPAEERGPNVTRVLEAIAPRSLASEGESEVAPYRFKRVRRVSVKGYSRLEAWVVKPRRTA